MNKKVKAAILAYKKKAAVMAKKELAVAKKRFNAAHSQASAAVKKNPEKAVLIATALGAALGAAATAVAMKKRK